MASPQTQGRGEQATNDTHTPKPHTHHRGTDPRPHTAPTHAPTDRTHKQQKEERTERPAPRRRWTHHNNPPRHEGQPPFTCRTTTHATQNQKKAPNKHLRLVTGDLHLLTSGTRCLDRTLHQPKTKNKTFLLHIPTKRLNGPVKEWSKLLEPSTSRSLEPL